MGASSSDASERWSGLRSKATSPAPATALKRRITWPGRRGTVSYTHLGAVALLAQHERLDFLGDDLVAAVGTFELALDADEGVGELRARLGVCLLYTSRCV